MDAQKFVQQKMEKARAAQAIAATFSQEQIDAIVKNIGKKIYENREILAREAFEKTRLGRYENKVAKHISVPTGSWHYMKDKKSIGIIEEDTVNHTVTFAKPMGVVASICPSTNPTTTAAQNAMIAIKCANAVIVAPHPRAAKCSEHCVALIEEAILEKGGPENLIQVLEEPTIERSAALMDQADVIVATGGAGMVKAAYSHGTPSFGVGQGNIQCVVGPDYEDFGYLASCTIANRAFDNGMPCTGEQILYIPAKRKEEIIAAFEAQGAYMIREQSIINHMRDTVFVNNSINRDIVGKTAPEYAHLMGFDVPENTKVLMGEIFSYGEEEILCREIMCPFIRLYAYDDVRDAVEAARINYGIEGAGHSSVFYTNDDTLLRFAAKQLPVGRLLVNQPGSGAAGNTTANGLNPTMSVGCGTWGGNALSENLTYKNLMNVTKIAYFIEAEPLDPQKEFAD